MEFSFSVHHNDREVEPPAPSKHGAVTASPDVDSISREINILNRDAGLGCPNKQLPTPATKVLIEFEPLMIIDGIEQ